MGKINKSLSKLVSNILKNVVYTSRSGLIEGMRRRGGSGFLPWKKPLTKEHQFLKSLDYEGKTIYDVGGHIGLITMFFSREAGPDGQVVTFEPNPQNYASILDHLQINYITNVKVLKIGLGSKKDVIQFVVPDSALGTASPEKQQQYRQGNLQTFQIEIDTLDHLIEEHHLPSPGFIKIDVEGLELDVLHGMPHTLNQFRPVIFLELHGVKEREVLEFLLSHDYRIHQVEDDFDISQNNIEKAHGHLYALP